jgi:NADPH2:quinone reductase
MYGDEKYGPPSILSIQELPVADLRAGEALIELHASAINPGDVKNVAGARLESSLSGRPS